MPDAGWAIIGHPPTLSQERDPLLVSTSPENVSTRHQWFARARLRDPHLTGIACLFPQRSRQGLLTDAAWGGLKPAPESRLRRAYPSSSIQLRKPDGLAFVTHHPLIFIRLFSTSCYATRYLVVGFYVFATLKYQQFFGNEGGKRT